MSHLPLFDAVLSPVAEARERGHVAAARAGEKAERINPAWLETASAHVQRYGKQHAGPWLMEDARSFAEAQGLAKPPDGRAWGAVTQGLKRDGRIAFAGYASAKSSNGSPKCLWRIVETTA